MTEGLSIVIPTYRRVRHLENLLQRLQDALVIFPHQTEVILVDDTPGQERVQIEYLAQHFGCKYLPAPRSVSAKRNTGIQHAKYDYILLLDSDCEPTPELLTEHWNSLAQEDQIGGCLGLLRFKGPESFFWDVINLTHFVLPFYWPQFDQEVPWGPTANISFKRRVLLEVNGFDETFPPQPGGEDVDLGLRITRLGYRIVTNSKALVYHTKETWIGKRAMFKRLYVWGKADYQLYIRHPQRVFLQFPRSLLLMAFHTVLCMVLAIIFQRFWLFVGGPLWISLYLSLQAFFQHIRFGRGKPSSWAKQLVCLLLGLADEAGYFVEAVRRGDWKALFYKMRYTDGQQIGEYQYGSVRLWSSILALSLLVLIFAH